MFWMLQSPTCKMLHQLPLLMSITTGYLIDLCSCSRPDLKTLLTTLASKVCIEETPSNMINVCRENIMDGAMRAFARRSFNPEAKLSVVFMDDFMQAEGSVDEGGPTREFFRLLMMALKDGTLFTGPQNSKNLSLDSHGWYPHLTRSSNILKLYFCLCSNLDLSWL